MCVAMFLAILHLRMLGLLGMIARLGPSNILHQHGIHILLSSSPDSTSKSWFLSLRLLTNQYSLPDPLLTLQSPPTKYKWKSLCKSRVLDHYEKKLRAEADHLDSLEYFKPAFMSLNSPHPIWTCANSPFEVSKAVIAAKMLSGRYRTDRLSRHWTNDNPDGLCRLPGCSNQEGNLPHILLHCPALSHSRSNMIKMWSAFMVSRPALLPIVHKYTIELPELFPQFLLDPSCLPLVISTNLLYPDTLQHCMYLARTWCFSSHLARAKILHHLKLK